MFGGYNVVEMYHCGKLYTRMIYYSVIINFELEIDRHCTLLYVIQKINTFHRQTTLFKIFTLFWPLILGKFISIHIYHSNMIIQIQDQ